jgi:hypothetical protein
MVYHLNHHERVRAGACKQDAKRHRGTLATPSTCSCHPLESKRDPSTLQPTNKTTCPCRPNCKKNKRDSKRDGVGVRERRSANKSYINSIFPSLQSSIIKNQNHPKSHIKIKSNPPSQNSSPIFNHMQSIPHCIIPTEQFFHLSKYQSSSISSPPLDALHYSRSEARHRRPPTPHVLGVAVVCARRRRWPRGLLCSLACSAAARSSTQRSEAGKDHKDDRSRKRGGPPPRANSFPSRKRPS